MQKDTFVNPPYQNICGRSVATNSLVVHGNAVPAGAYPWLAALFAVKDTGLNYMCSASLFSEKHVVTGTVYFHQSIDLEILFVSSNCGTSMKTDFIKFIFKYITFRLNIYI